MKESFFQLKEQNITNVEFIKNNLCNEHNLKLEFKHNIKVTNINEREAVVSLEFSVFNKKFTEKIPFYINIKIEGIFIWKEINDEDLLNSLLYENAPAVLLSFIRSMISQITAYSGYPTLIIPLLNFKKD